MIVEALIGGLGLGLCIAVARRFPWYGGLCLFIALTLLGIVAIEYGYSATGKVGIFGVLVILPIAAVSQIRKALQAHPASTAAMKYVYGTYGAVTALSLWGAGRAIEIIAR